MVGSRVAPGPARASTWSRDRVDVPDLHLIYHGHGHYGIEAAPCPPADRDHRRGHRGQQRRLSPLAAGRDRDHPAGQGAAAQPGRLHRTRVQLHLPGRPLQGDDGADQGEHAPVQGARRVPRVRRDRGRAHRGAHAGARPADGVGQDVGDRADLAADPGRDQGAGPVHRRVAAARAASTPRAPASWTRCAPRRSCASAPSRRA